MANDLNQCNFVGRLGADPEVKSLNSGDSVVNFRIAVGWKTKEKEGAEWVSIVAFGKLAEICGQYLKKGAQVLVSGSMRTRKWQDKNGIDRYSTEIVADKMQMLGAKGESGGSDKAQSQAEQYGYGSSAPKGNSGAGSEPDFDDDIPF